MKWCPQVILLSQLLLWKVTLFHLSHCTCYMELLWRLWESSDVCLYGSDFVSDLGARSYCWLLCHIVPWLPSEHSITLPLSVPDPWRYKLAYAWLVWVFRIAGHCVRICYDCLVGFCGLFLDTGLRTAVSKLLVGSTGGAGLRCKSGLGMGLWWHHHSCALLLSQTKFFGENGKNVVMLQWWD